MADLRIVLIAAFLLSFASAQNYFAYQGRYPIVYYVDFKYVPTPYGYVLWYKTENGVTREEIGVVPDQQDAARGGSRDDSNPDTLGSSNEGRARNNLPLKNRKVSPKLLSSLAG